MAIMIGGPGRPSSATHSSSSIVISSVAVDAGAPQAIPRHRRFGSQGSRMIRARRKNPTVMRAIYRTLDPSQRGPAADAFRLVHHTLVIAGIAAVILSTVPQIAEEHGWLLAAVFHLTLAFFAMEYVLRLYATPGAPWAHPGRPWRDRIQWALSFAGLVDVFSTWFMLLASVLPIEQNSAHLACIIWLFKFVPYSEGLSLLAPREVQPGTPIMRRGEPGDCMYFVVSGEVEIRIQPKPLRLGAGAFFGEIALVTGEPRNATAVAAKFCVLLSLHLTDFRHLAARRPELTAAIKEEAERRLAEGLTKKA